MMNIYIYLLLALLFLGCKREEESSQTMQSATDSTSSATVVTEQPAKNYLAYEQRQGQHLYQKYCVVCHGAAGEGDGFNSFNIDPKPRNFTDGRYMNALSNSSLLEIIRQGGRGVNKSILMPSWDGRLSKNEQEYIVAYIRTFAK